MELGVEDSDVLKTIKEGDHCRLKTLITEKPCLVKTCQGTLHLAVKTGHLDCLKELIQHEADINAVDDKNKTALHCAVEGRGDMLPIMSLLIQNGANVNAKDGYDMTPLHFACEAGDLDRAILLLEHKASTDCEDKHERQAIHFSSGAGRKFLYSRNHEALLCLLIEKYGANVNAADMGSYTPLHYASRAKGGDMANIMCKLIEHGANVNAEDRCNETPLHLACGSNCINRTRLLLENKASPHTKDRDSRRPLHFTTDEQVISLLVEYKADVNDICYDQLRPLHLVCKAGNLKSVKFLLKNNASIYSKDEGKKSALHYLFIYESESDEPDESGAAERLSILQYMLEEYTLDVNALDDCGNSALHYAAYAEGKRVLEMMSLLIQHGADVNIVNDGNSTALYLACMHGHLDRAALLLEHNALAKCTGERTTQPIHYLAGGWDKSSSADQLNLLTSIIQDHQLDVNERDYQGRTALHWAAEGKGQYLPDIILLLIRHGADVNTADIYQDSPLHLACMAGNFDTAQLLLENKASVQSETTLGKQAIHLTVGAAYEFEPKPRLPDLLCLLIESYGADIVAKDHDGDTPLHYAVVKNTPLNLKIVSILIKYGADVNLRNNMGQTPFQRVCSFGCEEHAKLLLENKALVDSRDNGGRQAIHYVAGARRDFSAPGHVTICKLLFAEKRIDVNLRDNDGNTPLHYAATCKGESMNEVMLQLIRQGADVNAVGPKGKTPLILVCKNEHLSRAKLLLKNKVNPNHVDPKERHSLHFLLCPANNGTSEEDKHSLISEFLKLGTNVNMKNNNDTTLLHLACQCEYLKVVKLLLEHNAAVDMKDKRGRQAIHFAAGAGRGYYYLREKNADIVSLLTDNYGANVNAVDKYKNTAMHYAAEKYGENSVKIMSQLIHTGADVNMKNTKHRTPLHLACMRIILQNVELLLKHNAAVDCQDENGKQPILITMTGDCVDTSSYAVLSILCLLIEKGANPNVQTDTQETPLHYAAQTSGNGKSDMEDDIVGKMSRMIRNGAEVNLHDQTLLTPLHIACQLGHLDRASLLLQNKASPKLQDLYGREPLHLAAKYGYIDICRLLVDSYEADINVMDNEDATPLHLAISGLEGGRSDIVAELIQIGADVNALDNRMQSPLHYAAKIQENVLSAMAVLLQNGANVDAEDKDYKTPLHVACHHQFVGGIQLLLENKASVNTKDKQKKHALHVAILPGERYYEKLKLTLGEKINRGYISLYAQLEIISVLISYGADVNVKDTHGMTPLHLACLTGLDDCVKLLLENKGDVELQDNKGRRPVHFTVVDDECNQSKLNILKLLIENYGAEAAPVCEEGMTPLMYALYPQNIEGLEAVKFLLKYETDFNRRNKKGETMLYLSLNKIDYYEEPDTDLEVVKALCAGGADPNILIPTSTGSGHTTALALALSQRDIKAIRILLSHGSCLQHCVRKRIRKSSRPEMMHLYRMLIVAGLYVNTPWLHCFPEYQDVVPTTHQSQTGEELQQAALPSLMQLCRFYLRCHLMHINPFRNLFWLMARISELPPIMQNYVLYNFSLEDNANENENQLDFSRSTWYSSRSSSSEERNAARKIFTDTSSECHSEDEFPVRNKRTLSSSETQSEDGIPVRAKCMNPSESASEDEVQVRNRSISVSSGASPNENLITGRYENPDENLRSPKESLSDSSSEISLVVKCKSNSSLSGSVDGSSSKRSSKAGDDNTSVSSINWETSSRSSSSCSDF